MWVLVTQSFKDAKKDAAPFMPDRMLLELLYGVKVYGPYPTQGTASKALRTFPPDWGSVKVVKLCSLSEALDDPHAYQWAGDSPDE